MICKHLENLRIKQLKSPIDESQVSGKPMQSLRINNFEIPNDKSENHRKPLENLRLNHLATPRVFTQKYVAPKEAKCTRSIELVRDVPFPHRLEQLSLPPVRSLLVTRRTYKPVLKPKCFKTLNMHLQKSMFTLYSRLANIKMPVKKQVFKWSEKEWKLHKDQCNRLAIPRKQFKETFPIRPSKPIDKNLMSRLSTPRIQHKIFKNTGVKYSDPIWPVTKAAMQYQPTSNVIKLATPNPRIKRSKYIPGARSAEDVEPIDMYENPYDIPREYQKIKSIGIGKLSEPRAQWVRKKYVKDENAPKLFEISPNALKCKASEHTKKMAEPRTNLLEKQKTDCFAVSKKALKELPEAKKNYYDRMATPVKRNQPA